jgi:hypothetical protein
MLVDKVSLQSFAMVSSLTAALSPSQAAAEDPAALPTVTGPQSLVLSHRSASSGPGGGAGRAFRGPSLTTGVSCLLQAYVRGSSVYNYTDHK